MTKKGVRNVDFQVLKASLLQPHPDNWRRHTVKQVKALRTMLDKLGFVGALIVRPIGKSGKYQILDGHLRVGSKEMDEYPCVITDLSAKEARLFLASYDTLGQMAQADAEKVQVLAGHIGDDLLAALPEQLPVFGGNNPEIIRRMSDAEDELKAPVWAADVDGFLETHGEPMDQDERRKRAWVTAVFYETGADGKPMKDITMTLMEAVKAQKFVLSVLGAGKGIELDPVKLLEAAKLYKQAHKED